MQTESEKKFTDGQRLRFIRDNYRLPWDELAGELGVSRSMLHAVVRGAKRMGRDSLMRLELLEKKYITVGLHENKPEVHTSRQYPSSDSVESLTRENNELKETVRRMQHTIDNLSDALAAGLGRARALRPPIPPGAARASAGTPRSHSA